MGDFSAPMGHGRFGRYFGSGSSVYVSTDVAKLAPFTRVRRHTAVLDESSTVRIGAADDPGGGIGNVGVTLYELSGPRPA